MYKYILKIITVCITTATADKVCCGQGRTARLPLYRGIQADPR